MITTEILGTVGGLQVVDSPEVSRVFALRRGIHPRVLGGNVFEFRGRRATQDRTVLTGL